MTGSYSLWKILEYASWDQDAPSVKYAVYDRPYGEPGRTCLLFTSCLTTAKICANTHGGSGVIRCARGVENPSVWIEEINVI